LEIDHIGIVVKDIKKAVNLYKEVYKLELKSEIIYDSTQHVMLAMMQTANTFQVELIQPIDNKSPSFDFLNKGGGIHHLCFQVENINDSISELTTQKHLLFKKPVRASLLGNHKIAFLYSKENKQIIELVEKNSNGR